jgi:hypothetical protein
MLHEPVATREAGCGTEEASWARPLMSFDWGASDLNWDTVFGPPMTQGGHTRELGTSDQEIAILFLLVQSLTSRERLGDFASILDKFLRQWAKSSVLECDDADLSECCREFDGQLAY